MKLNYNPLKHIPLSVEIILPVAIGFALFYFLTDILYSGGRRENLAAKAESHFIEQSIKFAAEPAKNPGKVVTVSLTDEGLRRYPRAPSELVHDADLEVYTRVLSRIIAAKPRLVVISWLTGAHRTESKYWQPLIETLEAAPSPERIFVAYPIAEINAVPDMLKERFHIKEGEDCIYRINSFCSYNPEWDDWLIQSLADQLWNDVPPFHISKNLPHVLPNFILKLPTRESIPDFRFVDVLGDGVPQSRFQDKVVFVGNATSQIPQFKDNKTIVRRTFTASSEETDNLLEDGTPLHVFWAQMSQMFIDRDTVAVAPQPVSRVVLVVFGAIIVFALFKIGPARTFGFFLVYCLLYTVVNGITMKWINIYVPMFDVMYGGFLTFLFSAFGIMSYNNFKRFQYEAMRRSFKSVADLKVNFISLISHNLNTPIAKLQGLLDIMVTHPSWQEHRGPVRDCLALVAKLHICVKSVLITTSIEQGSISNSPVPLSRFIEEFHDGMGGSIKRLGLAYDLKISGTDGRRDDREANLHMDLRLVTQSLAAAMALYAKTSSALRVFLDVQPGHEEGEETVQIHIAPADPASGPDPAVEVQKSGVQNRGRLSPADKRGDFFTEILTNQVNTTLDRYRGDVTLNKANRNLLLELKFSPNAPK